MEEIEWWDFINQVKEKFPRYDFIARRQFTWLKDKNGKEIYEGDVIRWFSHISTYSDGRKENEYHYYRMEVMDWEIRDDGNYIIGFYKPEKLHIYEVVWNIYENPELLKY